MSQALPYAIRREKQKMQRNKKKNKDKGKY